MRWLSRHAGRVVGRAELLEHVWQRSSANILAADETTHEIIEVRSTRRSTPRSGPERKKKPKNHRGRPMEWALDGGVLSLGCYEGSHGWASLRLVVRARRWTS